MKSAQIPDYVPFINLWQGEEYQRAVEVGKDVEDGIKRDVDTASACEDTVGDTDCHGSACYLSGGVCNVVDPLPALGSCSQDC